MCIRDSRWILRRPDRSTVEALARRRDLPEVVAGLLVSRGHCEVEAVDVHLAASPRGLHDPSLLPGMEAATERLERAVRDGETVLVHGDYDVDGVTGTALLMRLLRLVGARARWHIPNRLVDGYSFGDHSLEKARETGATVVISVDNGTSAFETIAALQERGVDTVVTDHHEPPPPHPELGALPPAAAVVNPKLEDSTYPWRELCGGAVAFKLAWGLCQRLSGAQRVRPEFKAFLDDAMAYVAIATVSDVVPLLDENRIFARWGLKSLEGTRNPGLRALLTVAGLEGRGLGAEDVAFQIGPRINASGRLGSAARAVELFLSENLDHALGLARELDALNQERRTIEREVLDQARVEAARFADPAEHPVLVLAGEGWHQGVVGIVAARLVEEYGRPAVVIGLDGAEGRGSARSVPGFSVLEALHGGAGEVLRYGGHAQAAGLEVRAAAVPALREAVCRRARELLGGAEYPPLELQIDCELPLARMTPGLMRHFDRLAPFGERNEKPVLLSRDLRLSAPPRLVGAERTHLLLRLRQGAVEHKAMGFGMGARADELVMGRPVEAVYTPVWNTFRGETRLELVLHDFRVG